MKVLEDINVNGSGNFDNELTATSLSSTTSLFLQGFELTPYNPDGGTPDRLMYDGYVLLDEYNYSEYLDSSYIKKSGGTVLGKLGFSGGTYPQIYGDGNYLSLSPASDGLYGLTFDKPNTAIRARGNNNTRLGISGYRWSNVYSAKGDFSGQITSSVADGTAPFVVTSKTLVSNLNADMLDGKHLSDVVHSYPDWSLSQYNKGEWAKFFEFSHSASDLAAYVVIDFFNYESGAKHVFGRLHMTARATALMTADVANWGSEKCPQIKITSDDGLTFSVWMKIMKGGWHPYLKFNLINKQHVTYSTTVTFQDEEPTGTNTNYTVIEGGFARKLYTPVTLWGKSFDGSANISGDLTGVGNIFGSGAILIHSKGVGFAYNGDETKGIAINATQFKPYDSANGLLDLGSTSARWKGIYGQTLDLSGDVNSTNAPEIAFYRDGLSSWKIINNSGSLYFQNNYTTTLVPSSYFNVLTLAYTTGNATLKGSLTTGGNIDIAATAGTADISLTFKCGTLADSYYDYKIGKFTDANSVGHFGIAMAKANGTWHKFFGITANNNYGVTSVDVLNNLTVSGNATIGGNILPSVTKTLNLGQADKRWNVYAASLSAISVTSSLTPDAVDSRDLGSLALPWYCGYIDYLSPKEIWFNDDEAYKIYVDKSSLVVTSKLDVPSITTDELSSSTSPYLRVNAMSLDLYECELYGYDSNNIDVWNVDFAGNAWFLSVTQTSDVRYKNIKENIHLKLSDIAAAPTFKFSWANDTDGSTHLGTSAQYWQEIASELVVANKKTGKLGLDYSTAALVSAISIARELESAKLEILELKDKISVLEGRIV